MEENKKMCGRCVFWSLWTGECSEYLYEERDFDAEPCEQFEWEESYKPKE